MKVWFAQFFCGLFGRHDDLMQFGDRNALQLRCWKCGRTTAGWALQPLTPLEGH